MIAKRIFYCWFGRNKKSDLNKQCIDSWKKFCPDYDIIEINEDIFDYTISPYAIEGYRKGNWSAVSNIARLEYMCKENGFYLDTDIELFKSLDELRLYDGGFITEYTSGQPDVGILGRGSVCPVLFSNALEHMVKGTTMHKVFIRDLYALYNIHGESIHTFEDGFTVLGEEYIPHKSMRLRNNDTIGIHYYENSWRGHPINATDHFYPFQKVQVCVEDKIIHEDSNYKITIQLLNRKLRWNSMKVLGRINYFFNPKVVKIETKDFVADRIEWDETKSTSTTTTASGDRKSVV